MTDHSQPSRRPLRWLFRFSLFSLLLVMSGTSGYFAGYRWGYQQKRDDVAARTIVPKTYYVADLVRPISNDPDEPGATGGADFDELIDSIVNNVAPEQWAENGGGAAEIRPFVGNLSLIISASGAMHEELEQFLQDVRDNRFKLPKNFRASIQEIAARKQAKPNVLLSYRQVSRADDVMLDEQFASGIRQLTEDLGEPRVWRAGEPGFPEWAAASDLAVWPRRGGMLYFARRDFLPAGEAIVAGWWEDAFGVQSSTQLAIDQP